MVLPALLILATQVPQHFSTRVPDLNPADTARLLAADPAGNLFVVSTSPKTSAITNIHVVKTDAAGNILASFDFGGTGIDTPASAATDPQGNLIVAGRTYSQDFPMIGPLRTTGEGFVTKLSASLSGILFSTRLGTVGGAFVPDGASAVAIDPAGNIYVTGSTTQGFATTSGVLQPQAPVLAQAGSIEHGFVMEISAAGDRVVYATYFSGAGFNCASSNSPCSIFLPPTNLSPPVIATTPSAIAVDSTGAVVVAGTTNSSNLPVTAGAYATQCLCTNLNAVSFIAKVAPGGAALQWGTYLPPPTATTIYNGSIPAVPLNNVASLALDPAGNIVFDGIAVSAFPISPNAIQSTFPAAGSGTLAGYVAKMDSSGSKLLFSTWFGDASSGPGVLALDGTGNIWLTGNSAPSHLPAPAGTTILGGNFIAGISNDGSAVLSLYTTPVSAAGLAIQATAAGIESLGASGTLLISSTAPGPSLLGIAASPAAAASTAVAARELISFYGIGIGPATAQTASITNNVIANSLNGVQVLFDGVPAALLYAGPTQINVIVPAATAGRETTAISIITPNGTLTGPVLAVVPTQPQIFPAALNQDGTINSFSNPAPLNSIVAIWLTGGGAQTYTPDHIVNTTTLRQNPYPVSILTSDNELPFPVPTSLEVLYAGDAPGQPSGVTQVNFLLPPWFSTSYEVQIGDATAGFTIWVK